ncbi:trehalase family glycosidase [Granulicella sp. dw_53]|uniref:trehalase family glycosidase n=1 Tax=Granulicella sp. dw_53 TaxID=2719792 RepID=UPI001BD39D2D|nr:trehalase family glycosidase [Granulicella sp. dw_53]
MAHSIQSRTKILTQLLALALSFTLIPASHAQQPSQRPAILPYIHSSWDTLSRSMSDCKSIVDIKVENNTKLTATPQTASAAPILYLPAGMPIPPAVAALQTQCGVQIVHLPRAITHLGDVRVSEIPKEGLLYLPNPYVVPGGRFNEMYGWDSYFILLGLVADHRTDLARGMVENFFFEIENYGALLNANRTYYLTRSQPPFLSSMIREVYEQSPSSLQSRKWLERAYAYAQRDYALWTAAPHLAGDTGLARYSDVAPGPVPEMADDSTYYPDVIRWLLSHPDIKTSYLLEASEHPTPTQAETLATTSCDIRALKVCASAYANGHRLTAAFFSGDRAMRESGFDTSFRFGPFSGSTDQFAPVCLNSLLYKYEKDMQHFAEILGRPSEASTWANRAAKRKAAINRLLWNPTAGMFYDYNFVTRQPSTYNYLTAFYPLWAGLATPKQAAAIQQHLSLFERDGGLANSDDNSGTQWDLPYGWAPTNWLAVKGLDAYGFHADAQRLSRKFTRTVAENYRHDGTIREKYNVVSGSANISVAAGYKANVVGFGWTNGVYLRMTNLLAPKPNH